MHEANANVEQWKKQLRAYQEETERLRDQVRPPAVFSPINVWFSAPEPTPTTVFRSRAHVKKCIPVQGRMKMSAGLADFGSRL